MTTDRPTSPGETPPGSAAGPDGGPAPAGPLVHYANLVSDLAVDLDERDALRSWAEQAPREAWLLRPGDVLVSPVPVGEPFLEYVCGLTGVPRASVTVLVLPGGFLSADGTAPDRAAVEAVRAARAGRPVAAVLPTALDPAAIALADALETSVAPYPSVEAAGAALGVTRLLNTKAGFRDAARALGMRLPDGRVRRRAGVADAVRDLLASHGRVVVKPDRSAGGHGLFFLPAPDPWSADDLPPVGGAEGLWVVEERIDVARSVSIQLETGPDGTRALFSGETRTADGSFTGYLSPLPAPVAHTGPVLEAWGRALGGFLAERGYAGPFGLDAMVSADGEVLAGESNVRRTATTTPRAMVARLAARAGSGDPAWGTGKLRAPAPYSFGEAVERLRAGRLAYDPARGEGVVLYAGPPPDGLTWRYAVIAEGPAAVARYEGLLRSFWSRGSRGATSPARTA
ncbi:peptide ligase PGM1-related protein [Streptomyces sp. NPDC001744]|uniref:preATP grasp domain-containing protein n=1 Tax=Streptomyces sp. NPDC001744 TaxID=3364606 RepID=UPI0036B32714